MYFSGRGKKTNSNESSKVYFAFVVNHRNSIVIYHTSYAKTMRSEPEYQYFMPAVLAQNRKRNTNNCAVDFRWQITKITYLLALSENSNLFTEEFYLLRFPVEQVCKFNFFRCRYVSYMSLVQYHLLRRIVRLCF